jgi:hypothetical protein
MNYRSETYGEYLKLHSKDIIANIRKNRKTILIISIIMIGLAILSMSVKAILIILLLLIIFHLGTYGIILYVAPMTIHYKIFKHTSKQYEAIKNHLIKQKIDCSISSEVSKVSLVDKFKHYDESISEMVSYNIQFADIFETNNSIFIFPVNRKYSTEHEIYMTEYLPPIRLLRKSLEVISGVYGVYTINNFSEENAGDDRILRFVDKKYENQIELRLMKYNS